VPDRRRSAVALFPPVARRYHRRTETGRAADDGGVMSYEDRRVATDLGRGHAPPSPADPWSTTVEPAATAAVPVAEPPARASVRPAVRAAREIAETLVLALVIFLGVRLLVLNFRVDGASMIPNLSNREMLLVNRNAYLHFDLNGVLNLLPGDDRDGERIVYPLDPPERGDIIVFEPPTDSDKPYIKRVIALPGETVVIRNGDVYIDDTLLDEPYIEEGITDCITFGCDPLTIAEGEVFALGDNRDNSSDSRSFGPFPVENIIGKAWFTYWPTGDIGLVPHYDYPGLPER